MGTPLRPQDISNIKQKWAKAVVPADPEVLLKLYSKDAKLKPTLSNDIRSTTEDIKSYFVGSEKFGDSGFLNRGFVKVDFEESKPQILDQLGYDMGTYKFTNSKGESVSAHYTFIIEKTSEGTVLIKPQHSSLAL